MSVMTYSLDESYWENFSLQSEDIEFIYNFLLESETPHTTIELVQELIGERIRLEKKALEQRRTAHGDIYLPKGNYQPGQTLVFPALNWRTAQVTGIRSGQNPEIDGFQVIAVAFESGEQHEFAANLADHVLNDLPKIADDDPNLTVNNVLNNYGEFIGEQLENELASNPDYVRIGSNWFPRALLLDINIGHLNLAEAVLDMAGGGPKPTKYLIEQIGLSTDVNQGLLEFSVEWALQNDVRFDEVGPAGEAQWFLHRLEPAEVLEPPAFLRYPGIEYDRSLLQQPMLDLERELDDELSPLKSVSQADEIEVRLIFPHWRSGTLPLSSKIRHLFPTAFEAPRIRFTLVDGDSGEKFSAWVVREKRYVFGLKNWYAQHGMIPGSIVKVQRGKKPGEVILNSNTRRASREWMRTLLVGSDGGVVFAMLKQLVASSFDDRWAIAVPDIEALDSVWARREPQPLERLVIYMMRELTKLSPQGHVHAAELYTAINIVRRVPPAPILAILIAHPGLLHVGDLHFRLSESD